MNARSNCLSGIVNGIDYEDYNPETDKYIAKNYSVDTFRKEKIKNKTALQEELGLEKDHKTMMIGIVSRLTKLVHHISYKIKSLFIISLLSSDIFFCI